MRQRIGRYEVLEAVASGGFATVYRARDPQLGRVVALKVLHPHMAADPQYVERFLREARMAASISHPNVVTIHEVGEEGGQHFIAMEYLPSSLEARLRQGRLPVPEALDLARQVALALQAAHAQGIVHRDLKPANILLTREGTPRVSDFGIARAAELTTMTASGLVLGTPAYMSPEQAQGQRVDARSDLYSLGCVLYQMLTGALPYEATTPWEVIRQHIEAPAPPVRARRPEAPEAVEALVGRCLAKDPAQRFQSAGEFVAALAVVARSGEEAAPQHPGATIATVGAGLTVAGARGGGRRGRARTARGMGGRGWWVAVGGAVGMVAVVGALVGSAALRAGDGGPAARAGDPPRTPARGAATVAVPTFTPTRAAPTPTRTDASVATQATSVPTPPAQPSTARTLGTTRAAMSTGLWGAAAGGAVVYGAYRYITLSEVDRARILEIAVDSGSLPIRIEIWSGRIASDEHYWWARPYHRQIAVSPGTGSRPETERSPGLRWVIEPGEYTLLFAAWNTSITAHDISYTIRVIEDTRDAVGTTTTTTTTTTTSTAEEVAFLTKWGSRGASDGQFAELWGIAVDRVGNVYVADYLNNRVQVFSPGGAFLRKWGSPGWGDGQFWYPLSIAVDRSGNVYTLDSGSHRVQVFSPTGAFIRKWGSQGSGEGQFLQPSGIAVDGAGNVYVVEYGNHRVQVFSPTGAFIRKWGSQGSGEGQFRNPEGIAVDGAGNVYVADRGNNRVQVFNSQGALLRKWGSAGSGDGQFLGPQGIAVDTAGNVYVAESDNHRVQVFSAAGTFLRRWGSQGSGDGQFQYPRGIAVGGVGTVYVADRYNDRVQVFQQGAAGATPTPTPRPTVAVPTATPTRAVPTATKTPPPTPRPTAARGSLLANGDFEVPDASSTWLTYQAGKGFEGWMVEAGSIDVVGTWAQAASGRQSLDLHGQAPGTIHQDVSTTPGQTYVLRFAVAGNPADGSPVKIVEVWWGSTLVDTISFDTTGRSERDMGWVYHEFRVVADSLLTRLRFRGVAGGSHWGIQLDDVSVRTFP